MRSSMNLFLVFLSFGCAVAHVWTDCGSKLATISNVKISSCDDSGTECVLKRNTNVSIAIDFTTKAPVQKVNTVVHGIMMGMPVPFPLPNPNACQGTGLTCPLKDNDNYSYVANLAVLKAYPKVQVDVKWELQNPKGEDLVCIMIPAKIH